MIPIRISSTIHMNQLHIVYWNDWLKVAGLGRRMYSWIMEQGKGACAFFCLIRRDAGLLGLNTMNGFLTVRWKIKAVQYRVGGHPL